MKKHKIFLIATVAIASVVLFNTDIVFANTPKFSSSEANTLWNDLTLGLKDWIFLIIPVAVTVGTGFEFLSWNAKDSDEKDQKPFSKNVKRNVIFTIVVMAFPAILRIFGLVG